MMDPALKRLGDTNKDIGDILFLISFLFLTKSKKLFIIYMYRGEKMIFSKDLLFNGSIVKWRNGEILIYSKQEDSLYNIKDLTKQAAFFDLNYTDNLIHKDKSDRDIIAFNNSPALLENINFENWRYTRLTKEDFLTSLGYQNNVDGDRDTFYLKNWWANPNFSFKINFKDKKAEVVSRNAVFDGASIEDLKNAYAEVEKHYNAAIEYEHNGKDKCVEYNHELSN